VEGEEESVPCRGLASSDSGGSRRHRRPAPAAASGVAKRGGERKRSQSRVGERKKSHLRDSGSRASGPRVEEEPRVGWARG
jgi:hypothetical protein